MAEYKTPGVYVEEISTFPATVVRVATAVPVFIGYTELAGPGANVPTKVSSLVEYEALFGGEPTTNGRSIEVHLDTSNKPASVKLELTFLLYQCLRHFYVNGGGDAYICSVGTYGSQDSATRKAALLVPLSLTTGQLMQVDEPTLIVVPDAFALDTPAELGEVQVAVLAHCNKMQDRFGILDVQDTGDENGDASDFRTGIGTSNLKYGAAYYPQLQTSISPNGAIGLTSFVLKDSLGATTTLDAVANLTGDTALIDQGDLLADRAKLDLPVTAYSDTRTWTQLLADWNLKYVASVPPSPTTTDLAAQTLLEDLIKILGRMATLLYNFRTVGYFENDDLDLAKEGWIIGTNNAADALKAQVRALFTFHEAFPASTITSLAAPPRASLGIMVPPGFSAASYNYLGSFTPTIIPNPFDAADVAAALNANLLGLKDIHDYMVLIYDNLDSIANAELADLGDLFQTSKVITSAISAIRSTGYTLPPSGAMAGVYASVDAARGVWKAPANVSLAAVTSVAKMRDTELDDLNVNTTGKSINAIREFRGQGILVYGARTLAGNDNEWRYVPVRRLFIMVEESVKKATEPYVFEANDARTWLNVKSMIENFLTGIWRDGGLAGAVPQDAFFVKVGLGQTMTAQDILEGKMIIEIGMAAVRPAEFVILKFSHKLQES
jgi:hypothetical protein